MARMRKKEKEWPVVLIERQISKICTAENMKQGVKDADQNPDGVKRVQLYIFWLVKLTGRDFYLCFTVILRVESERGKNSSCAHVRRNLVIICC